jgi:hypothetical protein
MTTYKESGVDIEAGEELVRRIKKNVRSTFNGNVLADIGMFGAFYRASFKGIKKPVLVTSVDGVGEPARHGGPRPCEPLRERYFGVRGETVVLSRLLCDREITAGDWRAGDFRIREGV